MPITLFRYTFIRLCLGFLFFTIIFAGLNWVNLLVRSIELILAELQYPVYLLQHLGLVFVVALDRVIPISGYLATVYVVIKMRNSHELTIQQTMGLGKFGLTFPFIAFALTVALFDTALKFEFRPQSDNRIIEVISELEWTLDKYRIKPGRFLDFEDGRTIITEGVSDEGELSGLVMHFDSQGNDNSRLWVSAETGEINYLPDEKEFVLSDGQILSQIQEELDTETTIVIKFLDTLTFTEERITKTLSRNVRTADIVESILSGAEVSPWLTREIHERLNKILFSLFAVLCGGTVLIIGYKNTWNSFLTIIISTALVMGSYVLGNQLEPKEYVNQSVALLQYLSTIPPIIFFLGWAIIDRPTNSQKSRFF